VAQHGGDVGAIEGSPPPPLVTGSHWKSSVSFTMMGYVAGLLGAVRLPLNEPLFGGVAPRSKHVAAVPSIG